MLPRPLRLGLLALFGTLSVLAAPAGAAGPPDFGGVAISGILWWAKGHRFVAVQTGKEGPKLQVIPKTARRYAAWSLTWTCYAADDASDAGIGGGTASMRPVQPLLPVGPGADYCHVSVSTQTPRGYGEYGRNWRVRTRRQAVALTSAGREYVQRIRGAHALDRGLFAANEKYDRATRSYPAAERLVAGTTMLALPTASAVPPPGRIGLWTDGGHRLRVTYVLADGTLLYHDRDAATRVLSTNAQDGLDVVRADWFTSLWYDSDNDVEPDPPR